jgi:glycosyltransferase involved in cell wall biosynthesis
MAGVSITGGPLVKPLRIAHVTATFPPYHAGTGNVCYHNARTLARLGHELHVFTAAAPGLPRLEKVGSIIVHRQRPLLKIGNAPLLPQLPLALSGFDIVHLHYPYIWGAELTRLGSKLTQIPVVVSFHNDLIGDGMRTSLFVAYQTLSARLVIRPADLLCVVSLDHYRHSRLSQALAPDRPDVVELPNGVDTDAFHPDSPAPIRRRYGIPDAGLLLLFVAALDRAHHFKGLDRLLLALSKLPDDTRALIVGDGDLRSSYVRQAAALGLGQRVAFAGAVSNRELPPFYRAADITVLPSLPPESFGLVLIESLACGTPVVASNLPGVRTVVSAGCDGFLIEPGSVTDLVAKLRQMRDLSKGQRTAMGQAGRRKVEARYAWPRIGVLLNDIYGRVIDKRRRSAGYESLAEDRV